jgi:hypothetical protein
MSTNTSQFQSPSLITSRKFPEDPTELQPVLSKAYVDIANTVNGKTTGIYEKIQIVTGNMYYSNASPANPSQKRQGYRQVYTLASLPSAGTATIPTNIAITAATQFVNIYGVAQSSGIAVALTPWVMATPNDAPYLRVNLSTGNIEIITTSANWTSYSAFVVLEYTLN